MINSFITNVWNRKKKRGAVKNKLNVEKETSDLSQHVQFNLVRFMLHKLHTCSQFIRKGLGRVHFQFLWNGPLHQSHFDELWTFKKIFAPDHLRANKKFWMITNLSLLKSFSLLKTTRCFFISLYFYLDTERK